MSSPYPYLEKAEKFLSSAQLLANHSDLDSAASRLYYAMFYTAETLLDTVGKHFSSHQAVLAGYGVEFAKTGRLDPRYHRMLLTAFDRRTAGDYASVSNLDRATIDEMLADARAWLAAHPAQP